MRLCGAYSPKVPDKKSSQPRIDDDRAGPLEVFDVAGNHCEPMNEGCRRNQSIGFVAPVGNMQMGAARRDCIVDGNYSASEFRPDMAVQPGPQPGALVGIAPLHTKDPTLQFKNGDRREEEEC